MEQRKGVYFVSDVHLGLAQGDPADREYRFVSFLKAIPRDSEALWLLGDIWDFWYEYKDVVPKSGAKVVAQLLNLIDAGVKVFFIPGNHDIWTYSFLQELGIVKVEQPYLYSYAGKNFMLGHGDGIGGADRGYRVISWIFHNRCLQWCFSNLIHPSLAFRFGNGWSNHNRGVHKGYEFVPCNERTYKWASQREKEQKIDYFIFGHYHCDVHEKLPGGAEFHIMDSWLSCSPYLFFDGQSLKACQSE